MHFNCVAIARCDGTSKSFLELRFVVHELEKWLTERAALANTENIFRRRIKSDDQQILIEQNDT